MRDTRRGTVQRAIAATTMVIVGLGTGLIGFTTSASAADACEPRDAYTEVSEWVTASPGQGWSELERRTITDEPATTETTGWVTAPPAGEGWTQIDEQTVDGEVLEEAHWQRYSYNGPSHGEGAPVFPGAHWQANAKGDPHGRGVAGAYNVSNDQSGRTSWFYLEWVEATYAQVTEYKYERTIAAVTYEEYRFAFDHAAVTCEPDVLGSEKEIRTVLGTPDCQAGTVPVHHQERTRTETSEGGYGSWSPWTTARETTRPATEKQCPGTPGKPTPGTPGTPGGPSTPEVLGSEGAPGEAPEVLGVEAKAPAGAVPAAVPTAVDAGLTASPEVGSSPSPWIAAGAAFALAGLLLGLTPATPRGKREV